MNAERGFRRLAWVSSVVIFVVATAKNALVNDMTYWYGLFWQNIRSLEFPTWVEWLAVGFPFLAAALPWTLFYSLRWVARGFKGSN